MQKKLMLLAFIVGLVCGCQRRDVPPSINPGLLKREWKLDRYLVNGIDMSAMLLVTNYTEVYAPDGSCVRGFQDKNRTSVLQTGRYEWEGNSRLKMSGLGSVEMSTHGTVSSSYYDVRVLTEKEFGYSFTNGGATHEFYLVPR